MIIQKIELKNFRQYIDTEVEFSMDPNKNVTIIMGDNGTGKTTLAQAFQWVLYGETNFQIKELLNIKVREAMNDNDKAIVSVSLHIFYNNTQYEIKRRLAYKKLDKVIKEDGNAILKISFINNKGIKEYLSDNKCRYLIRNVLPQELSKFFFFDGEKIEEMSKNIQNGKGDEFKEAVYSLVGLKATQNAMGHLKAYGNKACVLKKFDKEITDNNKSSDLLKKYNEKIEKLTEEIQEKEKDKQRLLEDIFNIESEIEKNQKIIYSETPKMELKKQYQELEKRLEKLETKKNDFINKNLLRDFKKGFYGFCMIPLMNREYVQQILEKSAPQKKIIPGLTKKTIDFLLERGECLCGTCLQDNNASYQNVKLLLEYSYPKTIGMLKEDFRKCEKNIKIVSDDFFELLKKDYEDLADINGNIEGIRDELDEKMEGLANTSKGEEAKKNLKLNKEDKRKKENKLRELDLDIAEKKKERQRQETEKSKLVLTDQSSTKFQRYYAYAERLLADFVQTYKDKENSYRSRLEDGMNNIFNKIYDGNIQITITEDYRILVKIQEEISIEDEVEKNTAQSYALIFAFITAVIELAKKKVNEDALDVSELIDEEKEGYPLVMDAPLSAFDTTRIKSICTEIPRIADQVIMFIKDTDGNIAEQYLYEKIGMRCSMVKINDSNLESQIIKEVL